MCLYRKGKFAYTRTGGDHHVKMEVESQSGGRGVGRCHQLNNDRGHQETPGAGERPKQIPPQPRRIPPPGTLISDPQPPELWGGGHFCYGSGPICGTWLRWPSAPCVPELRWAR